MSLVCCVLEGAPKRDAASVPWPSSRRKGCISRAWSAVSVCIESTCNLISPLHCTFSLDCKIFPALSKQRLHVNSAGWKNVCCRNCGCAGPCGVKTWTLPRLSMCVAILWGGPWTAPAAEIHIGAHLIRTVYNIWHALPLAHCHPLFHCCLQRLSCLSPASATITTPKSSVLVGYKSVQDVVHGWRRMQYRGQSAGAVRKGRPARHLVAEGPSGWPRAWCAGEHAEPGQRSSRWGECLASDVTGKM